VTAVPNSNIQRDRYSHPDILWTTFVCALFLERIASVFKVEKLSIEGLESTFTNLLNRLAQKFEETTGRKLLPPDDAQMKEHWQTIMRLPHLHRRALEAEEEEIATTDKQIAREYRAVVVAKRHLAAANPDPELEEVVSLLGSVLERFARATPRPAHRPPSSNNAIRFRTAAIAAAEFRHATGVSPLDSRKWAATLLNAAGLRRDKKGSIFSFRTIQNWSSKGEYEKSLLKDMQFIAAYARAGGLSPCNVAQAAIATAIEFGKRSGNYS
jgi:hypothetical protein